MYNFTEEQLKLIEDYRRLVFHIYYKYYSQLNLKFWEDDFIQEGFIGLMHAVSVFDQSRDLKFTTLAYKAIINRMRTFYRNMILKDDTVSLDEPVLCDQSNAKKVVKISDMLQAPAENSNFLDLNVEKLIPIAGNYRKILERYLQGYTHIEIAKELGISKQYVSIQFNKIIRALREQKPIKTNNTAKNKKLLEELI